MGELVALVFSWPFLAGAAVVLVVWIAAELFDAWQNHRIDQDQRRRRQTWERHVRTLPSDQAADFKAWSRELENPRRWPG